MVRRMGRGDKCVGEGEELARAMFMRMMGHDGRDGQRRKFAGYCGYLCTLPCA